MSKPPNSRFPGFFKLPLPQRVQLVADFLGTGASTKSGLGDAGRLSGAAADDMIENCVGTFELPMGIGTNLRVNGVDRLVPMAVEEPSVVAGFSNAARFFREGVGVLTSVDPSLMIAQIQLLDVRWPERAEERILAEREALLESANAQDPGLVKVGGGARDLEVRVLYPEAVDDPIGPMLVVHLIVDVKDAMGANAVNTMAECLAPRLAELAGGRALLRICSNLADRRLARASVSVPLDKLRGNGDPIVGSAIGGAIEEASVFADRDPYRAATNNKGIMNGVDAVLVALGQDWRAAEAGAHAYAARAGRYRGLSRWRVQDDRLTGELEMPLAVGTVGGIVSSHPRVRAGFVIANIKGGADLAGLVVSVGLIQNFAALRALATVGIQQGHMRLHTRKIARELGAEDAEIRPFSDALQRLGHFDLDTARRVLAELRDSEQ